MKKNILNRFLIIIVSVLLLNSCKVKRHTILNSSAPVLSSKSEIKIADIKNADTQFQTFAAKGKASINIEEKSQDVNINLRIKKNETIWLSLTALAGIEVARLIISPDSVKFLNRLNAEYILKPFDFINQFTNENITFQELQALLLGNSLPLIVEDKQAEISIDNNQILLSGSRLSLNYTAFYSSRMKLSGIKLTDTEINKILVVDFDNFTTEATRQIPLSIKLKSIFEDRKTDLDITYQMVQFDMEQDYPFNIPQRFTLIE